jgi:hypothetical protein
MSDTSRPFGVGNVLELRNNDHVVTIKDEGSTVFLEHLVNPDQKRYELDNAYHASSVHSVNYGDQKTLYSCLLTASGAATGVHPHSGILHNDQYIIAVSNYLVSLQLPQLDLVWQSEADLFTCFGVYHLPDQKCYISHEELEIVRVTYEGQIVWSSE